MKELLRLVPVPKYGNYGGKGHSGEGFTLPYVDDLDRFFYEHDRAFEEGLSKRYADRVLASRLKNFRIRYSRPVYGRLYQLAALVSITVLGWL